MPDFRRVKLPETIPGHLYLHSMPGRFESLEGTWTQVRALGIGILVCLAPEEEIRRHAPEYSMALAAGTAPCEVWMLPIPDFGPPEDDAAFARTVRNGVAALREGQSLLVHCGAGIGRTGTFAVGLLMGLGLPLEVAQVFVRTAGSGPERPCQVEALRRLAQTLASPLS